MWLCDMSWPFALIKNANVTNANTDNIVTIFCTELVRRNSAFIVRAPWVSKFDQWGKHLISHSQSILRIAILPRPQRTKNYPQITQISQIESESRPSGFHFGLRDLLNPRLLHLCNLCNLWTILFGGIALIRKRCR